MLLRTGLIMTAFSVLLVAGVALVVSLRADNPAPTAAPAKALAAETARQKNEFDPGEKLEIDDEPAEVPRPSEPKPRSEPAPRSEEATPRGEESAPPSREEPTPRGEEAAPPRGKEAAPRGKESAPRGKEAAPREEESVPPPEESPAPRQREVEPLPISNASWPLPTTEELSQLDKPRYFDPDPDAVMTLTIEALGLYDVPVIDSNTEEALDQGVIHVPDTAYPWDESDQKNVFLAGHRTGVPGTDGRLLFFDLDELNPEDEIVLEDDGGNVYKYRVTDLFKVGPYDGWVADTLVDRDLLTLQTCTYPTFENRIIVRADRV